MEQMSLRLFRKNSVKIGISFAAVAGVVPAPQNDLGAYMATEDAELLSTSDENRVRAAILKSLPNEANSILFLLDSHGIVKTWNTEAEELLGCTADQIIGQPFSYFFNREARELGAPKYELAQGMNSRVIVHEDWYPCENAPPVKVEALISPLRDDDERFQGFAVAVKRCEIEDCPPIPRGQAFIDEVEEFAIFTITPQGILASWNKGVERIKGYGAEEFIGKPFQDLFTEEDRKSGRPEIEISQAAKHGKYVGEGWRVRKDGRRFWASVTLTALHDQFDNLIGFTKITRDLSKLKETLHELQQAEQSYKELVTKSEDYAISRISLDGHILTWNKGVLNLKGYVSDEFLGLPFRALFVPEDVESGRPDFELQYATTHGTYEGEGWRLRKDGTRFWASVVLTALRDAFGQLTGYMKITRDISQRKYLEEDLRKAKEAAESANRSKDAFIANVSHEMRTPLGAIIGFSELLIHDGLDEQDRDDYINTIYRNAEQLGQLINDILDVSKMEAGKLVIEKERFNFPDFLRELSATFKKMSNGKGLNFKISTKGSIPQSIVTDPLRLRQILLNIVGNAIKFTSQGEVSIELQQVFQITEDFEEQLLMVVKDTGIGISKEQQTRLFLEFSQADESTSRQYGGTGLGLALSKRLAKALGGDLILLESTPGKGSAFQLMINIGKASENEVIQDLDNLIPAMARKTAQSPEVHLDGVRILVAEDSADNQVLIKRFLTHAGASVEFVTNGQDAVARALASDFDMILMDIQMPRMDGTEATIKLKAEGYPKPIIALTAHALKEEHAASLENGFSDYLTKPVNRQALLHTIFLHVKGGAFIKPTDGFFSH
jgi:PAS domain S-box-containing protein